MDAETLFWGAIGLLLVALGVEAWHARREAKKRQVLARRLFLAALTGQQRPLETPRVIGRIGRRA